MITRTTTVGNLKNYRYNLNRANSGMAASMNTVLTQRTFNSYAEDPAKATRAFQLRRSFMRTSAQLTVNESLVHKYDVAWQSMETVSRDLYSISADTALGDLITGENDPDGTGRPALGQSLMAKAQSLVQTMNGRYGENYIFAGADMLNPPFTWEPKLNPDYIENPVETNPDHATAFRYIANIDDSTEPPTITYTNDPDEAMTTGRLNPYYEDGDELKDPPYPHGEKYLTEDSEFKVNEETGEPYCTNTTSDEGEAKQYLVNNEQYDPNVLCKYLKSDGTGTNKESEAATYLCYRGVPVDSMEDEDREKMEYFLRETKYQDVGLGHKEQNGVALSSTVFNSALQGIYYTGGYGAEKVTTTVNGKEVTFDIPNNIISITHRLGEILQRCSSEDGSYASDEEEAEAELLIKKFEDVKDTVIMRRAELDTDSGFLRDNTELLTNTADSLSQQFMDLEDVNMADAITAYMYARYCFDSALKVGNSVLSQSLMDYMSL